MRHLLGGTGSLLIGIVVVVACCGGVAAEVIFGRKSAERREQPDPREPAAEDWLRDFHPVRPDRLTAADRDSAGSERWRTPVHDGYQRPSGQHPPGQAQHPPGQAQHPPGQAQHPPGQAQHPPGQAQARPSGLGRDYPPGQAGWYRGERMATPAPPDLGRPPDQPRDGRVRPAPRYGRDGGVVPDAQEALREAPDGRYRAARRETPARQVPGAPGRVPPGPDRHLPPGAERHVLPGADRLLPPGPERHVLPGPDRHLPPGPDRHVLPGPDRRLPPGRPAALRPPPPDRRYLPGGPPVDGRPRGLPPSADGDVGHGQRRPPATRAAPGGDGYPRGPGVQAGREQPPEAPRAGGQGYGADASRPAGAGRHGVADEDATETTPLPVILPGAMSHPRHGRPDGPPGRFEPPSPASVTGTVPPPAPVPQAPGGLASESADAFRTRNEAASAKLEQLKDLYLTAEAIGEEALDRHFEQVSQRQRELIREFFEESGSLGPKSP